MTRDLDLTRRILHTIEDQPPNRSPELVVEGADPAAVREHVVMLIKGRLIEAVSEPVPEVPARLGVVRRFTGYKLTWEGRELCELVRDPSHWEEVKQRVGPAPSMRIVQDAALQIARERFGLTG